MTRLLIQFLDEGLTDFRWVSLDETADSAALPWQVAAESTLTSIATQIPHPVVMILPQQLIYLTQVELPEKAGRQILSAIEYQVEDQLAQEIESQHFALGDPAENPIAIAVVSRVIMQRCLSLAQVHGLRLIQIAPEIFLCPWSGEGIALTEGQGGYLLRYGNYRGLKCEAQALPMMLTLLKGELDCAQLTYYGRDPASTPEFEGFDVEYQDLRNSRPGLVTAPIINLQQRDFQLSSAWKGLLKAWKWIGLMLLMLVAVGAYNKAVALHDLERELDSIKQQQYELLKPYLPPDVGVDANLKKLLIERLQRLQADQNEQGFLQLLLDFSRAREQHPAVQISRISYQGKRLSFEISSNRLNDIEALLDQLQKQGLKARLENLNIKSEQTAARLILQGGDNV